MRLFFRLSMLVLPCAAPPPMSHAQARPPVVQSLDRNGYGAEVLTVADGLVSQAMDDVAAGRAGERRRERPAPMAVVRFPDSPAPNDLRATQAFWATLDSIWAERDAPAFRELFSEDASFTFVDRGVTLQPRTAIDRHFIDQFATQSPNLRHVSTVRAVRPIAPGVLAADVGVEVSRIGEGGSGPALLRRFDVFSVMRHLGGQWRIELLRATLVPSASAPSDSLPADLRRAMERFDHAQVNADTATLARLVTEDYILVNSDATVDRKAKYLSDFLLPGIRMEPYVIEERVEKAWGDVAVVFGLQRLSWIQDGTRHRRDLRIVHVWTKRSGDWQVSHTQLTRIPGSPPTG